MSDIATVTTQEACELLREILLAIRQGEPPVQAARRLIAQTGGLAPQILARAQSELLLGGESAQAIIQLCQAGLSHLPPDAPPRPAPSLAAGHPLHTFMAENLILVRLLDDASQRLAFPGARQQYDLIALFQQLQRVERHYRRLNEQILPRLRGGSGRNPSTGPLTAVERLLPEVCSQLQALVQQVCATRCPDLPRRFASLARSMAELVFHEQHILFPVTLDTLDDDEWVMVRQAEEDVGYAWTQPAGPWPARMPSQEAGAAPPTATRLEQLVSQLGSRSRQQVNQVLSHLPVQLSFVDEEDRVRYCSAGLNPLFSRTAAILGRKVQSCHPQASQQKVAQILAALHDGTREVDEFWIPHKGLFLHIRYFALRDEQGLYRGSLEVVQEVVSPARPNPSQRERAWTLTPHSLFQGQPAALPLP